MLEKMRFRFKHSVYLSLLFVVFTTGWTTVAVGSQNEGKTPVLIQDLTVLSNSDGKILEQEAVKIKSKWSDGVECYKIRYLSDGLKVVGFVVKPKADGSKFPAIIFNRGGHREFGKITKESLTYLSYLSSKATSY